MQTTVAKESSQTVHVKASCARCGVYLAHWSLVQVSPLSQVEESQSMRSIVDLGTTTDSDTSDLFPIDLKSTYIGPEHAILFDDMAAAKSVLRKAVDLNPLLIYESPTTSLELFSDQITGEGVGNHAALLSPKTKSKQTLGTPQIPQSPISCGLLCPSCSFLLASHPTSPTMMMGIERDVVVLYKRSLTLSMMNVPFAADHCLPPPSLPFTMKRPACHNKIPIIYSRADLEAILLKPEVAHSTQGENKKEAVSTQEVIHGGRKSLRTQTHVTTSDTISNSAPNHGDSLNIEDNVKNNTARIVKSFGASVAKAYPEDLVIVMVGEFWCPFCVSAVQRLSDYNCRHASTTLNETKELKDSTSAPAKDLQDRRFDPLTHAGPSPANGKHPATMLQSSDFSNGMTNSATNAAESSITTSSLSMVPITSGLLSRNKALLTRPFSGSGGNMRCTYLLLDSLQCAGGVDPLTILFSRTSPSTASALKSCSTMPITTTMPSSLSSTATTSVTLPSFHVWFRGCRVLVQSTSHHFTCSDGAIVGLDFARYADLVIPRIARKARFAFDRTMMIRTLSAGFNTINQSTSSSRHESRQSLRRRSCLVETENYPAAASFEERRSSTPLGSVKVITEILKNTSYSQRTSQTGQDLDQLPVLKITLAEK